MNLITTFGWYLVHFYTFLNMWWVDICRAFKEESQDNEEKYPFSVIKSNGYYQINYNTIEVSDIKFIQTQIEYDDTKYEIDLNPFMVVGNVLLGDDFVEWIMEHEHGILINNENTYKVQFIDNEANIVTLDEKEFIVINKDNYLKKSLSD